MSDGGLAFEVAGERPWIDSRWRVERERGQRVARERRSTMEVTSSTPDVPGASGTEREEGGASLAPTNEGSASNVLLRTGTVSGTAIEEDWAPMATGDPAFWLKD
jgi:hypothetical protein